MGPGTCWRCLARTPETRKLNTLYVNKGSYLVSAPPCVSFSTATRLSYPPPRSSRPGAMPGSGPPKRGQKRFLIKKKGAVENKGRPPAPGERKAFRKRIVLSNTNALEVPDMQDLGAETIADSSLRGQVVGIPGPVVDQLRAIEAFKPSQGWGFFRRPGMLVREETLKYGKLFESMSNEAEQKTVRKIVVGERASGKSTMLLQAMAMAFLKEWVIISIPEGQDLSIGHTEYGPLPGTSPTTYVQKVYLAALLSRLARANPLLSTLTLSQTHTLPIPLQSNLSLLRLAHLGASDPEIAHPVFLALWTELTTRSTPAHPRPKILLALDGLGHIMQNTAYLSASLRPIHAHDLHLVQWYLSYLSGAASLPNGGLVLAATSESNHPAVPTLRLKLAQLEAQQALSHGSSPTLPSPIQPFLDATGQPASPIPQLDPFVAYDERVLAVFAGQDGQEGSAGQAVEVQRLKGLRREEARGLMEYWAKSGMMRARVSEGLVGEKWTVSGGGVVGELERGCVRMRV